MKQRLSCAGRLLNDDDALSELPLPEEAELVLLTFCGPRNPQEVWSFTRTVAEDDTFELEWQLGQPWDPDTIVAAGFAILGRACYHGSTACLQLLLEAAANVNKSGGTGLTPLAMACARGRLQCVRLLLEALAEADHCDQHGRTPLWMAAQSNHAEIAETLLKAGAFKGGAVSSPLWIAAERGHLAVAETLLEAGAEPDEVAEDGSSPLWIACQQGHVNIIRLLLRAGASRDKPNEDGALPVWVAAHRGHDSVVQLLSGVIEAETKQDEQAHTTQEANLQDLTVQLRQSRISKMQRARAKDYAAAWDRSVEALQAIGGTCVEVDYAPFQEAANLLYQGPWVAERLAAIAAVLKEDPQVVQPTVRKIVEQGSQYTAQQCFEASYRMRSLQRAAEASMEAAKAQVLVTPTVGATYKIEDVLADPIALNTNMGRSADNSCLFNAVGYDEEEEEEEEEEDDEWDSPQAKANKWSLEHRYDFSL
ncbi:atzF [Symbiodinium natans]|uniref:AtzF protein n=1 Tax=Symbiodinium natans TaxID=878477 RepID=A0A812M0B2_9DINO|nr:atzF [Symbiodinium natans]